MEPIADRDQERIARGMTEAVVDQLEIVQVDEQDDRHRASRVAGFESRGDHLGEERPVGQPGERVMGRLVMELLLQPAELLQRLLQPTVLQGDRGVIGEGLEELEVLRLERADVAQRVRDQHGPDQGRLAQERRHERLADRVPPAFFGRFPGGQVDEAPLSLGHRADQDRVVEGRPDRLHDDQRAAGAHLAAEDVVALPARQQADLCDVRPEHLPSVLEQRDERGVELRAALQDAGRFVEELDALVLLSFGDIGAIRQGRGHDGQGEEPDRGRIRPQDGEGQEGEARVRQRHDDPDLEHLRDPPVLRGPLRQGDRGADAQDADHVLDERDQEDGDPDPGPEAAPGSHGDMHEGDRDHRGEAELGEVERELDPALVAIEDEGEPGTDDARDDERRW